MNLPKDDLIMKIEDLSNNAKLDRAALDEVAGGGVRFVWKKVRVVRYVFGVKIIAWVWKLVAIYF